MGKRNASHPGTAVWLRTKRTQSGGGVVKIENNGPTVQLGPVFGLAQCDEGGMRMWSGASTPPEDRPWSLNPGKPGLATRWRV